MTAGDVRSPAPSTKEPSAPFGNLDQARAAWMRVERRVAAVRDRSARASPEEVCARKQAARHGYTRRIMAQHGNEKRRSPIPWRPPADRWDEFDARVAESGLSRNAFLTEAVFGRNRHRAAEINLLARILGVGQAIADGLKPFNAAAARDADIGAKLDDIRRILIDIRSALFRLMGRTP